VRAWTLGILVFIIYKTLSLTWRVKIHRPDALKNYMAEKSPVLLAHWHGDELALIQLARSYRIVTLSSHSKDGSIMTVVLNLLGAEVVRGSSSRGAVSGYLGLVRKIKKGFNSSFAVDGPRGPIYKAKMGVVETSKNLQIPIFFAGVSCDRAWVFKKSWNQTYLPKPFAKLRIVWTGPLAIPQKSQELDHTWLEKVEFELRAARQQAPSFIAES